WTRSRAGGLTDHAAVLRAILGLRRDLPPVRAAHAPPHHPRARHAAGHSRLSPAALRDGARLALSPGRRLDRHAHGVHARLELVLRAVHRRAVVPPPLGSHRHLSRRAPIHRAHAGAGPAPGEARPRAPRCGGKAITQAPELLVVSYGPPGSLDRLLASVARQTVRPSSVRIWHNGPSFPPPLVHGSAIFHCGDNPGFGEGVNPSLEPVGCN